MPLTEILEGVLWQSDTDSAIFTKLWQRGLTPALVIDLQEFPQPDLPLDATIAYIRWPIEDGPIPDVGMLLALERACLRVHRARWPRRHHVCPGSQSLGPAVSADRRAAAGLRGTRGCAHRALEGGGGTF